MENHNVCIQQRVSLTNLYIVMHLKLYYSVREGRGLHGWHNVNCTILVSDLSIVFSVIYHILNLFHYAYLKDVSVKQIVSFFLSFVARASCVSLLIADQLDALNFSIIFICLSLSICFGHYVPIIRRDPIALTQLLYLSFRLAVYIVSTIGELLYLHL
jgi:hypothetical protein